MMIGFNDPDIAANLLLKFSHETVRLFILSVGDLDKVAYSVPSVESFSIG
jgi:hypothetical protein